MAPAATTTYTITASNKAGSTKSTALLTVNAAVTPPTTPSGSAGLPVITSFSATPSSISAGSSAVLNWSVTNATGAKISGIGTVATSGSSSVYPSTTTTYVLEAYNSTGQSSASTVISVAGSPVTPPSGGGLPTIVSFAANPAYVTAGSSTVLSWNVANAATVSITGLGSVSSSGSMIVTPTSTITLTLSAYNAFGTNYATTSITVGGSSPPVAAPVPYTWPTINDFHNSGAVVGSGGVVEAKLYWSVSNADTVIIDNGIGSVGASGSQKVYPVATTTYTLMASNSGNTVAQTTTVVVTPVAMPVPSTWPTINDFHNSGIVSGPSGLEAKLYWSVSNADTVIIDHGVGAVGASGSHKSIPRHHNHLYPDGQQRREYHGPDNHGGSPLKIVCAQNIVVICLMEARPVSLPSIF